MTRDPRTSAHRVRTLERGFVQRGKCRVSQNCNVAGTAFDVDKTVTMTGTVKEFEWTNPHSWLRIMVDDQATGKPLQWALEMGSPGQQSRVGWKPDSVKPGDKVTITMHPLKDGSRGGQFMSATLPGGKQLGNGGQRNNPLGAE